MIGLDSLISLELQRSVLVLDLSFWTANRESWLVTTAFSPSSPSRASRVFFVEGKGKLVKSPQRGGLCAQGHFKHACMSGLLPALHRYGVGPVSMVNATRLLGTV